VQQQVNCFIILVCDKHKPCPHWRL